MNDEPLDLSGLRPPEEVRERVVEGALERIGNPTAPSVPPTPLWRRALRAPAPYAVPALLAAAVVVLLLATRRASDRGPGMRGGEALAPPPALVEPPGPWDAWIAGPAPPGPRQLLVTFAEGS